MLLTDAATWELVLDPAGDTGAANMAADTALLERAAATGRSFLRLYRFAPPCLSLGRHEPAARYDPSTVARLGIDVVRRPTGGGAVWHERDVTYAVATPIATFGSLRTAYRAIHQRLATALATLGVPSTLAPDRSTGARPDRRGACFATPVGGEVLVAGRKLVGSAQRRRGDALLQHGSILLAGSQAMVRRLSGEWGAGCGETTLAAVLGRAVSFDEVAAAVIAAWGGDLDPSGPGAATVLVES